MINQNENSNSNNIQPHLLDIDKMIGHPKPKYNNIHHLDGVQNDPGGLNTTNFKQEYTVLIRKKRYYSSTSGIDNNHKYLQIIQLNNFLDIKTSISTEGSIGQCSVTLAGNTKVVCADRGDQDTNKWGNNDDGFFNLLNGWAESIEDNTDKLDENGNIKFKDTIYDNLDKMKAEKYGWKIVEKCDIQPMDEIYVFGKSRKIKEANGRYKVYQIFFGYITSVNKSYSPTGGALMSIQADDHLKLLQISYINNSPGMDYISELASASFNKDYAGNLIIDDSAAKGDTQNLFTNVFAGRYPYEIILKCARDAGVPEKFLEKRIERITKIPFMPQLNNNAAKEVYQSDLKDRLSFCKTAAEKLFLEFFADEEGNIVLKIPNWTLGVNRRLANNMYLDFSDEDKEQIKNAYTDNEKIKTETKTINKVVNETIVKEITHKVEQGDTLWNLAGRYLGDSNKWKDIYELNKGTIKNENWLCPGQVLKIREGKYYQKTVPEKVEVKTKVKVDNPNLSQVTDKYIKIIRDDEIISFNLCDSDRQVVNSIQVQQEVPLVNAAMEKIPQASKRAIQDWNSIAQFGIRLGKNFSTPLLDKDIGPSMFGALMLQKSIAQRYKGTLRIIEESSIRVGDPIRFFLYDEHPFKFCYDPNGNYEDRAQAIFYVTAVERQISADNVSTMTLSLSAGRVLGMESTYDNLSVLYGKYYVESKPVPIDISRDNGTGFDCNFGSDVAVSNEANKIINYTKGFVGVPYVWGGTSPKGFDCSGLVYYCFKKFGYNLPRTSQEMAKCGTRVSSKSLLPGDLVFWDNNNVHHVALYIGDGKIIEAPRTGLNVRIIGLKERGTPPAFGTRILKQSDFQSNVLGRGGSVSNMNYVGVIKQAVITNYTDIGPAAGGGHCDAKGRIAAAHGMPAGTKIYIPALKGKVNNTGIFEVLDTGGPFFDFDINTTYPIGKVLLDVYILSWGRGKKLQSFAAAIAEQQKLGQWDRYSQAYYNWKSKFKTENLRI